MTLEFLNPTGVAAGEQHERLHGATHREVREPG